MRVSMQNNIDLIRRVFRCYVLKTKLQSAAHEVHNQWPIKITVAIASHHSYATANRAKLVENRLCANIAKMPDFISVPGHFSNRFRQTIVRVRQDEDA